MKNATLLFSIICTFILIRPVYAQQKSEWVEVNDDQFNGFVALEKVEAKAWKQSGYETRFEIKNLYPITVKAKITFQLSTGLTDDRKYEFSPKESMVYFYDTQGIKAYKIQILEMVINGKRYNVEGERFYDPDIEKRTNTRTKFKGIIDPDDIKMKIDQNHRSAVIGDRG